MYTSWIGASFCSAIDVLGYGLLDITIWSPLSLDPWIIEIEGLDWGHWKMRGMIWESHTRPQSCISWTGASLCSVIDVLGYGFLATTIWASSPVEPLIMEIDLLDWGQGKTKGKSFQNTTSGAKWLWMGCWGFHLAFITTCPGPVLPTQLPCHMQFILQDLMHCHDFWAPSPLVIIMWLDNPWLFGKRL